MLADHRPMGVRIVLQARLGTGWQQVPQVRACVNPVQRVHLGNGLVLFSQLDGTVEHGPTRKVFP